MSNQFDNCTNCIGSWMNPKAGLDMVAKGKIPIPAEI
jgi:hypothetical protein